jgi:hypothetical protein
MELNAFGSLVGSAFLRHVSAEGCQLMVESIEIASGLRFAIVVPDSSHYVLGTVRWLVGSRAGFAFDTEIGHDLRAILESQHPLPTPVLLYSV